MNLGERIAKIRRGKGMSQAFITNKLGKTPAWLSNIEKGRRGIGAEELHQVADILGVGIGIFFKEGLNEKLSDDQGSCTNQPTGTDGH